MILHSMTDPEILDEFKRKVELMKKNVNAFENGELDIVAERFEHNIAMVYEAEQMLDARG